jgi:cell fate regulator YaaT (PSP1 superfamily)
MHHVVRYGALAYLGRFGAVDGTQYPRGSRVILRTSRGLEVGDVLSPPGSAADPTMRIPRGGSILRGMTTQDELLQTRLTKNRDAALAACQQRLCELGSAATLIDVEHLFDGRSLYFYFLGDLPPDVEEVTAELARAYDVRSQFSRFAETLTAGCGPDCGTASAAGCGSCSTGCAISFACRDH